MSRTLYEDAGEGLPPLGRAALSPATDATLTIGPREGDYEPARVRVEVVGRGVIEVPEGAAEVTLP